MSNKKYYWLKLHKDFFKSKEIKKLRKIAGGDTFVIIYLKMQLLSIESNGLIEYEEIEPTFAEELALELDEDETNVNATILFLESMGMLKEAENSSFVIPHVVDLIGSETPQARSMRKKRVAENQRVTDKNVTLLQDCYTPVTPCYKSVTTEIEIEIEKEIDNKKHTPVSSIDSEIIDSFEKLWVLYERKGNKASSLKIFAKLTDMQKDDIRSVVVDYVKSTPVKKFRKDLQTYLNPSKEHWKDEIVILDEKLTPQAKARLREMPEPQSKDDLLAELMCN